MNIIQTNDLNSWQVSSNLVQYSGVAYIGAEQLVINVNPSFPYIYLPDDGWRSTTAQMLKINPTLICDFDNNNCKF